MGTPISKLNRAQRRENAVQRLARIVSIVLTFIDESEIDEIVADALARCREKSKADTVTALLELPGKKVSKQIRAGLWDDDLAEIAELENAGKGRKIVKKAIESRS